MTSSSFVVDLRGNNFGRTIYSPNIHKGKEGRRDGRTDGRTDGPTREEATEDGERVGTNNVLAEPELGWPRDNTRKQRVQGGSDKVSDSLGFSFVGKTWILHQ